MSANHAQLAYQLRDTPIKVNATVHDEAPLFLVGGSDEIGAAGY